MYCSKCGRELPEGADFCPTCGIVIDKNPMTVEEYLQKRDAESSNGNASGTYNDNSTTSAQGTYNQGAYNQNIYTQNPYSQNNYDQDRYMQQMIEGKATTSVICGVVGLFFFPPILGIIAIINAASYRKKIGFFSGKAKAGLILGILDLVLWVLMIVMYMTVYYDRILAMFG